MLYFFYGPDDFTRTEKIAELRAAVGDPTLADLNVTQLDGRELKLGEIRNYTDAMPFMADRRLVVVNGYLSQQKGQEELKQLVAYLQHLPPTTDLVFVESETFPKNHPLLKTASEIGATVMQFAEPDKNSLRSWIMKRVQEYKAAIEPEAADLLGRLVGSDLRTLNNEIEKLTLYVDSQRAIQRVDVELLTPYTEESEDFGLASAIGQRNARKAYDQLRKLLDEGKHPMSILGSIAAQVRGLLEVKDMAERGLSPAEIAKVKGWRSDYAAKMRMKEAANFSIDRLEDILEMLLEIDLDIKTGRVDSLLALDTLVARLCVSNRFHKDQ
jgi:DNA polymerase-3 subunit delta